ncbi:unnamed protein product [Ectocarpus sp. 6 AP-2014]
MQVDCTDRGTSPPAAGSKAVGSPTYDTTIIRNCGDIPSKATVHAGGALKFLGDIDCGKTSKTIEFMGGDTEIRSPTSITTMGLTLIVHPAARLTIQAPTVSLARTEASALEREEAMQDDPVLVLLGSIDFQVTTWLEQPLDGTVLDERGVVWVGDQGVVMSDNSKVTYTATSVVVSASKNVADPVDSSKEASFHKADPVPSSAAAALKDGDGDKNVPVDDVIPTTTATPTPLSPSAAANPSTSDRAKADRKKAAATIMITELMDRARERHNLRSTIHNGGKTEVDDEGKGASPITEPISGAAAENQAPKQQEDQHDETAMVYATSIDGSVVHVTVTGTPPGDLEDRTVDPVSQTRRTLLEANPQRMSIVEGLRAEIVAETEGAEKAAVEDRGLKKSKMVTVLGFLPFGKHGFRRRRARERAAAHLGEAALSVTNKGDLEVSVDGSIVLRKSGPSWFGFRKKDSTYEVRVTEDGVVVSRGGKYDWGIQVREPLAQVVPPTSCFCDKYPDV